MSSVPVTVAQCYQYVVGIDTHAATHTLAVLGANGALIDRDTFPTSPAGLARAIDWIGRRTGGEVDSVLVSAEGTGSYGALLSGQLTQTGYRVIEAPTPARVRGRAKSDALDALLAAQTTLATPITALRTPRTGSTRAALAVLLAARRRMQADRTRSINALTALVRTYDLGMQARRALTATQITQIATWRTRHEPIGTATARAEATRLAKHIHTLQTDLKTNNTQIRTIVTRTAPHLLDQPGIGPITAAIVLTAWSHPGRIHSEAAFAKMAGTSPLPASSGNTTRHRLNRTGDRHLNHALHTIAITRTRYCPTTRAYTQRRQAEGKTPKETRRCLKRYITRQLYRLLTTTPPNLT